MGNSSNSPDKKQNISHHNAKDNIYRYNSENHGSRQKTNIRCIVSAHYQDNATECHDIILQFRNNVYDFICVDIHNNFSSSSRYSMEQAVNNTIVGSKCTIQSISINSDSIFIGSVYDGSTRTIPKNQPGDLIKIPLRCIIEINPNLIRERMENNYFVKNGDIIICMSVIAIDQIQRNVKRLKESHNDYYCKKYNYSKGLDKKS